MITFILIGSFIITGIAASYYCDKIFGDAGYTHCNGVYTHASCLCGGYYLELHTWRVT